MNSSIAKDVPLVLINFPPTLLRLINRHSLEYIELRDSIQAVGLINSICVRESPYRINSFDVIDGVHRYVICRDLGWETIPCVVRSNVKDEEIPWLQLHANAHRKETTATEYVSSIRRLLLQDPEMTLDELCVRLNKKVSWVKRVMVLFNLCDKARDAVDSGKLGTLSAFSLARLPKKLQDRILPHALLLQGKKCAEMCGSIIRGYKEAKAHGNLETFLTHKLETPRYLRPFKHICQEYDTFTVGALFINRYEITDPMDAWKMALAWMLHIDPESEARFRYTTQSKHDKLNKASMARQIDRKRLEQAARMKIGGDLVEILT